jgi:hypothetical protein
MEVKEEAAGVAASSPTEGSEKDVSSVAVCDQPADVIARDQRTRSSHSDVSHRLCFLYQLAHTHTHPSLSRFYIFSFLQLAQRSVTRMFGPKLLLSLFSLFGEM